MKSGSFLKHFSQVPDPRKDINRQHLLIDILFITICAVLCGARGWSEIADFGNYQKDWFLQFLKLPNGIPSHDTFRQVFLFLDTDKFNESFGNWVLDLADKVDDELISIDGKTNRRTRSMDKKPLHMVSAWANKNSLVLAQVEVDQKSNEITAIPKILRALEIKGCLVTIDAMGCQRDIAEQIIDNGGDYALALKGNQGLLHEQVKDYLEISFETNFEDVPHKRTTTMEKDHGRIEKREYFLVSDIDWLEGKENWKGLNAVGLVVSHRKINGKTTVNMRFYLTSLGEDIERFAKGVRGHWGVENCLHWQLDVTFQEDQCRKRMKNSAANFAIILRMAINMLKKEKTFKGSIVRKQLRAAMKPEYREKVLQTN